MRDVVFEFPDGSRLKVPDVLAGNWYQVGGLVELEGRECVVLSAAQSVDQLTRDGFEVVRVSRLNLSKIKELAASKAFHPETADEMLTVLLAIIEERDSRINELQNELRDAAERNG